MFLEWLKRAFSDSGEPSSSRVLTAISTLTVLVGWVYVAFHTGHLPDAAGTTGAAALAVAPYTVNRIGSAIETKKG